MTREASGWVIVHDHYGVLLAVLDGVRFWSKTKPGGFDKPVALPTYHLAQSFARSYLYDEAPLLDAVQVRCEVDEHGMYHSSIEACIEVGIPKWNPMSGKLVQYVHQQQRS